MSIVELSYFEASYNKKNQQTIVTDIDNFVSDSKFVIKAGKDDTISDVSVTEDLVTVINKVKPNGVALAAPNKKVQDFCAQIGIPCSVRLTIKKPEQPVIENKSQNDTDHEE